MRRVIKIGGSLLLQDSLAGKLQSWVDQQPPGETIAIVGGGELIDTMRRLDAAHRCDPSWVHWQCIALLRTTFDWFGQQLDDWQICSTVDQFQRLVQQGQHRVENNSRRALRARNIQQSDARSESTPTFTNHLVAVDSFYYPGIETPLPEDWTTTSDAIAGWLSVLLNADELVLLKSCDVDETAPLAELAARGVIDAVLPSFADLLPKVRFVNFATETAQ